MQMGTEDDSVVILHLIKKNPTQNSSEEIKRSSYLLIKGTTHQDVSIVNIYVLSHGPPWFIKQMLQGIRNHDTVIVRDFNTQLISVQGF